MLTLLLLALNSTVLHAQRSELSSNVQKLSEIIASDDFHQLCVASEFSAIDSLYHSALSVTNSNTEEALLALTFSTVPYDKVPIKFIFRFTYPLISADDSIFRKKNQNLPKRFLPDSPADSIGDKDKLAHFFGSAFVAYTARVFDLTKAIGYFVEVFEENFTPENHIDSRDLKVDQLGELFGKQLKGNPSLLPSSFIKKYKPYYE